MKIMLLTMNRKYATIAALLLISPLSYFVVEFFFADPPKKLYSTSAPLEGSRLAAGRTRIVLKQIDGLRLIEAQPGSLLASYGLKVGDLIFKVDGSKIVQIADFEDKVREHLDGQSIYIEYYRGKEKKSVTKNSIENQ